MSGLPARGTRARFDRSWAMLRALADTGSMMLAGSLTHVAAPDALGNMGHAALVLVTLVAVTISAGYRPRTRLAIGKELAGVVTATSVASLAVGGVVLVVLGRGGVGDAVLEYWVASAALLGSGRAFIVSCQRAARSHGLESRRTLIVGAGEVGQLTARRLLDEPQYGLRPIGFLDKDPLLHEQDPPRDVRNRRLPVLGASWDLPEVLVEQRVDQVVVAFSTAPHSVLLGIVHACWQQNVPVLVVPRLFEVEGRRVEIEHVGALPLIALHPSDPQGWQFAVKYALDRILAATMLLVLSPLLAVVALAVLVTMGRPLFFRQMRVGRDGHEFEMLKFRTMHGSSSQHGEFDEQWAAAVTGREPIAGAPPAAVQADRRTLVGRVLRKCSLDELPQLWNVVRGDMSLIGPRPERSHYVDRFQDVVYRYPDRHRVKSGLTGWAQVHGLRGDTSLADRIEWDNFYIENWSPGLDVKILWMTLPAVLGRRGAR